MPELDHYSNPAELLKWHRHFGLQYFTSEAPVNWFERPDGLNKALIKQAPSLKRDQRQQAPAIRQSQQNTHLTHTQKPPQSSGAQLPNAPAIPDQRSMALSVGGQSVKEAISQAGQCQSLDELKSCLETFDGCSLKRTAKHMVFARGNLKSGILFLGEAPLREDDISGTAMAGDPGALFDKMRASISLDDNNSAISNMVFWRPPGGRTPTPEETAICLPFAKKLIDLTKPKLIILLGAFPAQVLLQENSPVMRLRGRKYNREIDGKTYDFFVTLPPSYLLKTPLAKRLSWQDLLHIKDILSS